MRKMMTIYRGDGRFLSALNNQFLVQVLMNVAVVTLASVFFLSCNPIPRKLDEAIIYEGPQFRVKLVRYYENMLFHYVGEVFRVQCSSARTTSSLGHKHQDAGWVIVGSGGAIGSKSAIALAERERRNYIVVNDHILVSIGTGLSVSFDDCGHFEGWYPTALPSALFEPDRKPDYRGTQMDAGCEQYDFLGNRQVCFEGIQVSPQGHISFVVRSKAFRHDKAVRVQSVDFGETWEMDVL